MSRAEARPIRVLLAEDDASVRHLLVDALTAEGFDVRAAANGAEALDLLPFRIREILDALREAAAAA